jgi:predicted permease
VLINDLRFTISLLLKRPGMSCLIFAALLFGIGVNTAIFSVVNAVLLRPLPIFQPERVVRLYATVNQTSSMGISYPEYLDWKAQNHSFEALSVIRAFSFILSGGNGLPEHLKAFSISACGFDVFGVSTILGRNFNEEDDRPGASPVVILSYAFWDRRFAKAPTILGRSITLDDHDYTIIGVLQAPHINLLQYPDVWVPNGPLVTDQIMSRERRFYFAAARLKPTITFAAAQADLQLISSRLASQYPNSNKDMGIRFVRWSDLLIADSTQPLSLLLTASTLIFFLACINTLTLLLSNTADRSNEFIVRAAMGATRFHIARQLFIQAFVFVAIGTLLSLLAAKAALILFMHRFPNVLSRLQETSIDFNVILFISAMALATIILATALPAWYALQSINKTVAIRRAFSKYGAFRDGIFIAAQVALASALALVSGLLVKSFYQVTMVDLGFNPQHVFSFQLNLPPRYTAEAQSLFYQQALEKFSNAPGMSATSGISSLPLTTQGNSITLQIEHLTTQENPFVENESVLPALFQTLEVPLLQGREFTAADRNNTTPVAIVDDVLANHFWPGQTAVGKRIRLVDDPNNAVPWREIVGVVRQIKHFGPEAKVRWPQVYVPAYQQPTAVLSFVTTTNLPESQVRANALKAIHELDATLPLDDFQTMDTLLDGYTASRKASLILLSLFAFASTTLGVIGIYGVVSNAVVRRRKELAIRMALGATSRSIVFLIAKVPLFTSLIGITCGIAIIMSCTRILSSLLFGITALDSAVYLYTTSVILACVLLAALLPARTILHLNPQDILRQ